jgi:preprotein translocase YajC subunit
VNLLSLVTTLLGATTKKSSSNPTFLIFILIVVAALYFLFLRPNQQKAKKMRQDNAAISVGDRVVSIGGIVGQIEAMEGDRVVLLTGDSGTDGDDVAPTRLVLLRSAIARRVDTTSVPLAGLDDDDHDHDHDHDHDDHDHHHADHTHEADEADDTGKAEGDTGA